MVQAVETDGYAGALKVGVQREAQEYRFKYIPAQPCESDERGARKKERSNCPLVTQPQPNHPADKEHGN